MEETVRNVSLGTSRGTLFTPRALVRHRFSLSVAAFNDEDDAFVSFEELLNQTWTIFGVSALFGFQHNDEVQFKLYAKRLREEIASTLMQEDVAYHAEFSVVEGMCPRPSPMDPPAIKVEVFTKSTIQEDRSQNCIYKGILISWRTTRNDSNTGNSVRLPLLLCRGTRSCIDAVHAIMSRMFDCMVMAMPANENDLMWLVPVAILPNSKDDGPASDKDIKMEYRIPGLPSSDTIVTKFRVSDLVKMLGIVNNFEHHEVGTETVLDVRHIDKFHAVLHNQMLNAAGIQLGFCTLHKISLPVMTVMGNKIKITNQETMNRVLLYLNEKALDTFHTFQFSV